MYTYVCVLVCVCVCVSVCVCVFVCMYVYRYTSIHTHTHTHTHTDSLPMHRGPVGAHLAHASLFSQIRHFRNPETEVHDLAITRQPLSLSLSLSLFLSMQACMYACMRLRIHTCSCTHAHPPTHAHTLTHTGAQHGDQPRAPARAAQCRPQHAQPPRVRIKGQGRPRPGAPAFHRERSGSGRHPAAGEQCAAGGEGGRDELGDARADGAF